MSLDYLKHFYYNFLFAFQIRQRLPSDSIDGEMDPTLLEAVASKNYSAVAEVCRIVYLTVISSLSLS